MKKVVMHILGYTGALLALSSGIFYTLFSGTTAAKEFWIGVLLIIFASIGSGGVYFASHKRDIGKTLLLIGGLGGILTLLFLAGFGFAIVTQGDIAAHVAALYFGGYLLFVITVLFLRTGI